MIRAGIRRFSPSWAAGAPRRDAVRAGWPRTLVLVLVAIACAGAVILVARHKSSPAESSATLTAKALATVDGVPQSGVYLGSAKAPARMIVYADMTSVRYADFETKVLPTVVQRYVKPRKLQLQFATVARATRGVSSRNDAEEAALLAQAAGLQNKLWQFSGVLAAQYVGVLDSATVGQITRAVPGLDQGRVLADSETQRVKAAMARNTEAGQAAGASDGLAFVIQADKGAQQELPVATTAARQIAAIDRAVASLPARAPAKSGETRQGAKSAPKASTTSQAALPGMRARVVKVQSIAATSAAGKANHRIRVVVRLRVRNTGDAPLFGGDRAAFVYLVVGGRKVNEDRHVWPLAISFKQNRAIAPGKTRVGVLHFELGGRDGRYMEQHKTAQVGIRPNEAPGGKGKERVALIRFSTG